MPAKLQHLVGLCKRFCVKIITLHIARPSVAQIPMLVIDEFEIREGEFLLYQGGQLVEYRFCPMANQDDELVDVPSHPPARYLGVIALELGFFMLGLSLEILLSPNLAMQLGVVDERHTLFSSLFHHLWRQLFLMDAKERLFCWIIAEKTYTWHLFVKCLHVAYQRSAFFFRQLSHGFTICICPQIYNLIFENAKVEAQIIC